MDLPFDSDDWKKGCVQRCDPWNRRMRLTHAWKCFCGSEIHERSEAYSYGDAHPAKPKREQLGVDRMLNRVPSERPDKVCSIRQA